MGVRASPAALMPSGPDVQQGLLSPACEVRLLVAAPTGCSSTAERLVWDQEAAGSSPASQTDGRRLSLGEHSGRIREVGGSNPPRPTVRWRVGELVTRLALTQEIGGSSPPAPAARE